MSLINEALKKAQRLRHEQAAAADAAAEGRPLPRRARPMRAQTLLVLVAGAAALIVVSVVITVALLTRPSNEPLAPSTPVVVVTPSPIETAAPVIVAPVIPQPNQTAATSPVPNISAESTPAATTPSTPALADTNLPAATTAPSVAVAAETPAPIVESAKPATAPTATQSEPRLVIATPGGPDPLVQQFVDAVRVAGIRSSGTDSKVLMNDRVYRMNDIVERSLGLRLVGVAPDALTFADANGVTYVKTF